MAVENYLMDNENYEKELIIFNYAKKKVHEYINKCFNKYKFLLSDEDVEAMKLNIENSLNSVILSREVIASDTDLAYYWHSNHMISLTTDLLNGEHNDDDKFETYIHELFHAMSRKNYYSSLESRGMFEEGFAEAFTYLVLDDRELPEKRNNTYKCETDIIRTCLLLEKDRDIELLFRYINGDMKYFEEKIINIFGREFYKCTYNYDILNTAEMYQIEKLCFYKLESQIDNLDIDEGKEIYKINNNLYSSLKKSIEVDLLLEKYEEKYLFPASYSTTVYICECSNDGYSNFIPTKLLGLAKEELKEDDEYGIEMVKHFSDGKISFAELLRTGDFLDYAIELYLGKKIDGDLTKEDCLKILEFINRYILEYADDKFVLKKISAFEQIIKQLNSDELCQLPYINALVEAYSREIFDPFIVERFDGEKLTIDDLQEFKTTYGKLFDRELENARNKDKFSVYDYSILKNIVILWKKDDILKVWPDFFEQFGSKLSYYIEEDEFVLKLVSVHK